MRQSILNSRPARFVYKALKDSRLNQAAHYLPLCASVWDFGVYSTGSLRREQSMLAPFITVTSARVKEGKLGDYMELNRRITELVEAKEPRIIAFHVMLNDDRERFVGLQFHPDAQSMEFHLEVARELIAGASDMLTIDEFKVLGTSSEVVDGVMESMAESGIKVEHFPSHVGGFTRSSAAD